MASQHDPSLFLEVFGRAILCLPILFILCSEGFSGLYIPQKNLDHSEDLILIGDTPFHTSLFVDDSLLFAKAGISQEEKLKENFSIYEDCSERTINYDESNIFFSKGALNNLRQLFAPFSKF